MFDILERIRRSKFNRGDAASIRHRLSYVDRMLKAYPSHVPFRDRVRDLNERV